MNRSAKPACAAGGTYAVVIAAALLFWPFQHFDVSAGSSRMILSLGDDSYITWPDVETRTGAVVRRELGESPLTDFSVVVLSNVSYATLPEAVRDGVRDYLTLGGALLVTGGSQSYGSGGYAETEFGDLLPLRPWRPDFGYHPYGPTFILQPEHPIVRGIEIPTMGYFNELELNSGSVEIARYHKAVARGATIGGISTPGTTGGARGPLGAAGGVALPPSPLIAERSVGAGTVLAIAIDMSLALDKGVWKDRDPFAQNCVEYLLRRSRIIPAQGRAGSAGGG